MAVLRLLPAIFAMTLAMTSPAPAQALLPARQTLTAMPSETQLVWGSVITINGDPCCEAVSSAPLEASPDAAVIQTMRSRAFRMGPVLWLKVVGDRSLRIIDPRPSSLDCHDYDVCRRHLLTAWWDDQRYYVVDVQRHEARQSYLISERDGAVTLVFAPPVRSPSGRYAIADDTDPAFGQGLQLIDLTSRPPKVLEVKSRPGCPGNKALFLRPSPVWRNDSTVSFEGTTFMGDLPEAKQVLRIIDGNPRWEC